MHNSITSSSNQHQAFDQLRQRVHYWQKLTQLITPILPVGGEWQVVYYEQGHLILAGSNTALNSQVRYLQQHFIAGLRTFAEFEHLHKLQVVMSIQSQQPKPIPSKASADIPEQNKQHLLTASRIVKNSKLSQALQRLAGHQKNQSNDD